MRCVAHLTRRLVGEILGQRQDGTGMEDRVGRVAGVASESPLCRLRCRRFVYHRPTSVDRETTRFLFVWQIRNGPASIWAFLFVCRVRACIDRLVFTFQRYERGHCWVFLFRVHFAHRLSETQVRSVELDEWTGIDLTVVENRLCQYESTSKRATFFFFFCLGHE